MSKNLKIVLSIVVVVVIVALLASGSGRTDHKDVVKIGVVAPLTGPGSIFGNAMVRAVKLAQEDMSATQKNYEVVIEDDGSNPGQAASAAQKLINSDNVQVLLTMTSGTGNAVKPIAFANKVPHICVCTDTTVANAEYNYTDLVSNESEARLWLSEAARQHVRRVGIIVQNHPGLLPLAQALQKYAPEYGMSVVHEEKWDPTQRDFKTIVAKSKAAAADLYWVAGFPPGMDIAGQELRDAGVKNLSSSAGFGVSSQPDLYEGLWYEDTGVATIDFRNRFELQFPDIRFNVRSAPFGYDMYTMVVKGFESGEGLNEYLSHLTSFHGMAGTTTQAVGTRNFYATPMLWVIKNGKAEPYRSN